MEINSLQKQILDQHLESNPLLRPYVEEIINSQLNTEVKESIIKAINEVLNKAELSLNTNSYIITQLVEVLGGWESDEEVMEALQGLSDGLIKSVRDLQLSIGSKGLQRTIIMYIAEIIDRNQSIRLYTPYSGAVYDIYIYVRKPVTRPVRFFIKIGEYYETVTLPRGSEFIRTDIDMRVDNELVEFGVVGDYIGVEEISASISFIQEKEEN